MRVEWSWSGETGGGGGGGRSQWRDLRVTQGKLREMPTSIIGGIYIENGNFFLLKSE